ncbi:hypothetical protein JW933_10150 [candidate division FCPU426 bacterium]|nr:hypothetical protein [candidate division FCPU426 bacterium]
MFKHCGSNKSGRVSVPRVIAAVIGGISLAVVLALGLGWVIMFLWNNTLTVIFHISPITYWQAVGLFILAKLFFSLGHHGQPHDHAHKKVDEKWHRWLCVKGEEPTGLPEEGAFLQYWQEEGRLAYEAYVERTKQNKE